jgi:hypothetical protein
MRCSYDAIIDKRLSTIIIVRESKRLFFIHKKSDHENFHPKMKGHVFSVRPRKIVIHTLC